MCRCSTQTPPTCMCMHMYIDTGIHVHVLDLDTSHVELYIDGLSQLITLHPPLSTPDLT